VRAVQTCKSRAEPRAAGAPAVLRLHLAQADGDRRRAS